MQPVKRIRDKKQLFGGEKTAAALALLFTTDRHEQPLVVLSVSFLRVGRIDAALNNTNVAKTYIRNYTSNELPFIVIHLGGSLYEKGTLLSEYIVVNVKR